MFDENGERHQRRSNDPLWKFFIPVGGTVALSAFGWAVSVENRVNTIQAVQEERAIILKKLDDAAHDPLLKPEVRYQFEQEQDKIDKLDHRMERLEERFNNFHQFLLQARPMIVPPSKRGEHPFMLEDKG